MKILFDSHCHIDDEAYDDCRQLLMEEIEASQLAFLADIGTNEESSLACIANAAKYPYVYAAVGYHPAEVEKLNEESFARLRELCKQPKVVAIGEIGLDYYWEDNPPKELQRYWFGRQIDLAKELGMPICIHSREADQECLDLLKEHNAFDGSIKVLLHCFSGSAELAKQYRKLGAYISMAGPVTYKNNRKGPEVVEAIGLDHLLIETDSPYLTPVPLRGQTNKPVNVKYTAEKIADILGLSFEEVAETTMANAKEFYGITDC